MIVVDEIFSLSMSKKEALVQSFRWNIGILIKEETEPVEGEVIEIQTDWSMHELSLNKLSPLTATAFQATNTGKLTNDIETIYGKND